jgi:hypothetical protein
MNRRPPPGSMVHWRVYGEVSWHFGYCTYLDSDLVRMGSWNGDNTGGHVVSIRDIEWRPYT